MATTQPSIQFPIYPIQTPGEVCFIIDIDYNGEEAVLWQRATGHIEPYNPIELQQLIGYQQMYLWMRQIAETIKTLCRDEANYGSDLQVELMNKFCWVVESMMHYEDSEEWEKYSLKALDEEIIDFAMNKLWR